MLIISPGSFTAFSTLALAVTAHVTECPVFLLEDHAKLAAREFFRLSNLWRSGNVTLLTTVAAQQAYTHTPPTNAELHRVFSAWDGDVELDVELPGEADDDEPDVSDAVFKVGARIENKLWLSPPPTDAGVVLKGTLGYIPTAAGAGLPTYAYDRWGMAMAAWAGAKLSIQPRRAWSNPAAYEGLMRLFYDAVAEASNEAGPVRRKPLRVKAW